VAPIDTVVNGGAARQRPEGTLREPSSPDDLCHCISCQCARIFRVTELAALQFDGQAVAAGQDDLDIAAPPAVRGPGLHPGREPLRLSPFPYRLLTFRMPQALRAVLSARRGHSGRMSEMPLASPTLPASGHERDGPRAVRQIRPLVARQAHQGPVTVVTLLPPLLCTPVSGVDLKSGHQVQADHEQICRHDASDDEHAAAGSERPRRMTDKGWLAKPDPSSGVRCLGEKCR